MVLSKINDKMALNTFVVDNQTDLDTYLPYVLFAYRKVTQESTEGDVRGELKVVTKC